MKEKGNRRRCNRFERSVISLLGFVVCLFIFLGRRECHHHKIVPGAS